MACDEVLVQKLVACDEVLVHKLVACDEVLVHKLMLGYAVLLHMFVAANEYWFTRIIWEIRLYKHIPDCVLDPIPQKPMLYIPIF